MEKPPVRFSSGMTRSGLGPMAWVGGGGALFAPPPSLPSMLFSFDRHVTTTVTTQVFHFGLLSNHINKRTAFVSYLSFQQFEDTWIQPVPNTNSSSFNITVQHHRSTSSFNGPHAHSTRRHLPPLVHIFTKTPLVPTKFPFWHKYSHYLQSTNMENLKVKVVVPPEPMTMRQFITRKPTLLEPIAEGIVSPSGIELSEEDVQPGGLWEQYIDWQLRLSNPTAPPPSPPRASQGFSKKNFPTPEPQQPISPFKRRRLSRSFRRQFDTTYSSQETFAADVPKDSNLQNSMVPENHQSQEDIAAVFSDFPAYLINSESKRLTDIGDDEYGLMAIRNSGSWSQLAHGDLPNKVKDWIALSVGKYPSFYS